MASGPCPFNLDEPLYERRAVDSGHRRPCPPAGRSLDQSSAGDWQRQDVVRIDSDAVQLARNLVHFLMVSGQTTATLSQVLRDAVLAHVETQKHQLNEGKDFPTSPHELRRGRRPTMGSANGSK